MWTYAADPLDTDFLPSAYRYILDLCGKVYKNMFPLGHEAWLGEP